MAAGRRTVLVGRVRGRIPAKGIEDAGRCIREGGLVVFPTETVYGLGADAFNRDSVKRIFEIKGRPSDNPIIVHVAELSQVGRLARNVPDAAERLMRRFWPGPLTVVLPKRSAVPDVVTGGLDTVSIRMPANRTALALIGSSATPIAAPSANLSGRPSITSFREAVREMGGRVDYIIDGGRSEIGVESTVLDMTAVPPRILRPGGLDAEELRKVIGDIEIHPSARGFVEFEGHALSPGMKYRHYSPVNAKVVLFEKREATGAAIGKARDMLYRSGHSVAMLVTDETRLRKGTLIRLGSRKKPGEIARRLFLSLREVDRSGVEYILAEGIDEKGIGLAVMNRLRRASGGTGPEELRRILEGRRKGQR